MNVKRFLLGFVAGLITAAVVWVVWQDPWQTTGPRVPGHGSVAAAAEPDHGEASHDPRWAAPLDRPGLPNLYQVSPTLYRGAQPTAEGLAELKKMGVKTDVNLRHFHSDEDLIGDTGLTYRPVPMNTWHPEDEDVIRFLRIITDPANQPVFVHCQHGADRTGLQCAVYRIFVQGWTKDQAIDEMTHGGYGFHPIWQDLIDYVKNLDVEKIRKQAGLKSPDKATQP